MSPCFKHRTLGVSRSVAIQQLLREWPPGYGGVERVAHELGNSWGGVVFSLDVQRQARLHQDSLPVAYPRNLFALDQGLRPPFFAITFLVTDLSFCFSSEPLHGHLPSPGVLLLLVVARLLRPRRTFRRIGIVF